LTKKKEIVTSLENLVNLTPSANMDRPISSFASMASRLSQNIPNNGRKTKANPKTIIGASSVSSIKASKKLDY
jgi:hypothetical protein